MKSAVHKDCRTPKYKVQIVPAKKGRGSFKRVKKVRIDN